MSSERLSYLFKRCLDRQDSDEERAELQSLLQDPVHQQQALDLFSPILDQQIGKHPIAVSDDKRLDILNSIFLAGRSAIQEMSAITPSSDQQTNVRPVHRVPFLRRGFLRYAAAVILVFSIAAYFWTTNKKTKQPLVSSSERLQTDILPGTNKALLTLSDGTVIMLDSAANGTLAQQGNTIVTKQNGQIIYGNPPSGARGSHSPPKAGDGVGLNTMTTPRGGQYQLILPDGSKVWLNAASSITYPTTYPGKDRRVQVTGEVYFDVAKNVHQPFIVETRSDTITVVGTRFNVNAYADEPMVRTTLIEGAVKVGGKLLQVGQMFENGQVVTADVNQVTAWQKGIFNFNHLRLPEVMRQVSRWYNIDVEYKGEVPRIGFGGKMQRDLNLSDVLEFLEGSGVHFQMEDKRLIVTK